MCASTKLFFEMFQKIYKIAEKKLIDFDNENGTILSVDAEVILKN